MMLLPPSLVELETVFQDLKTDNETLKNTLAAYKTNVNMWKHAAKDLQEKAWFHERQAWRWKLVATCVAAAAVAVAALAALW